MAVASNKDDKAPGRGSSVLAQLKCPLVFFGLSLTIIESTFGTVVIRSPYSERTTIIVACLMAGLFVVSMLTVAFLVYRVPMHLMLLADQYAEHITQRTQQLNALKEKMLTVARGLETLAQNLPSGAGALRTALRELSRKIEVDLGTFS